LHISEHAWWKGGRVSLFLLPSLPPSIFKELSILPFHDLINLFNLKFLHSYIFGYIPLAFLNTWPTVAQFRNNPNDQLCNDTEYHIPRHRTDHLHRMPFFNLPRLWTSYSQELSDTHIKHIYSKAVSNNLLHKLNSIPNCTRLLCPSCLSNNINNIL
jgi:hypothetical protein